MKYSTGCIWFLLGVKNALRYYRTYIHVTIVCARASGPNGNPNLACEKPPSTSAESREPMAIGDSMVVFVRFLSPMVILLFPTEFDTCKSSKSILKLSGRVGKVEVIWAR